MKRVADQVVTESGSDQADYMALTIGNREVLTASAEILSIEKLENIEPGSPAYNAIGSILYYGNHIPAYSMSDNLDVDTAGSGENTVCVVLRRDAFAIALACRRAAPFAYPIIRSFPLPECMRANRTPIHTLCRYVDNGQDKIVCVVSIDTIIRYINGLEGHAQDVDTPGHQRS